MNGKTLRHLVLAILFITHPAQADTDFYEGFDVGQTSEDNSQAFEKDSIADPIFNDVRADENQVKYNEENNSRGREYKADDAGNGAGLGMATAITTGSILVARGTPMLFSPFLPTQVAGANLIAKGSLEFAQAGASGAAMAANKDQAKLLNMDADPKQTNFNQRAMQNQISQKINTPELNEMLSQRGINADDFIRQVASGQLTTPDSILRASGNTSDFSPEDLMAGMKISGEIDLGGMKGLADMNRLTTDEDNAKTAAANAAGATGAAGAAGSTAGNSKGGTESHELGNARSRFAEGGKSLGEGKDSKGVLSSLGLGGGDMSAMMNSFLGKTAGAVDSLLKLDRSALQLLGITPAAKGQNIFNTAHRTYRSFGKWRSKARVITAMR